MRLMIHSIKSNPCKTGYPEGLPGLLIRHLNQFYMKLFTLSLFSLIMVNLVFAQSTPFTYPTVVQSQPPPILGTGAWEDPENAEVDPGYATSQPTFYIDDRTDRLYALSFQFNIPSSATITGVEVEVIRRQIGSSQGAFVDEFVNLMSGPPPPGGAPIGDNKADIFRSWEDFDETVVYGGPSDTWGVALTPSIVNSAGFGIGIVARRFQDLGEIDIRAQVRSFRIKVYYSLPLPIVLKSFDVRKVGSSANITWVTTEEVNVKGYEIQRSANGNNFTTIATVTPSSPNSQLENIYRITDDNPLPGRNFYRLKQTDLDGQFKIFPMKSVNFDDATSYLKLQAVPGGRVRISSGNMRGRYTFLVRDAAGRLLQAERVDLPGGSGEIYVNLLTNSRGILFVTLAGNDEQYSQRIFAQ
jgi:hypothetical protein